MFLLPTVQLNLGGQLVAKDSGNHTKTRLGVSLGQFPLSPPNSTCRDGSSNPSHHVCNSPGTRVAMNRLASGAIVF
jgi:hypothetical protein